MELLRQDLAAARLHEFENHDDVNKMWDKWHSAFMFMQVLNCHAPLASTKATKASLPPWSDRELFQLVKTKKNRLHARWLKDRANQSLHQEYKRARSQASTSKCQKRAEDLAVSQCRHRPHTPQARANLQS
eukprot:scpid36483/ scgid4489/ 